MNETRNILIGFDFGVDTSQICYYDRQADSAVSLPVKVGTEDASFPNCISTADGKTWHFGPEAEYFSSQKGESFVSGIYELCQSSREVMVAGKSYRPGELLAVLIRESLALLGLPDYLRKITSFMMTTPRISRTLVENVRVAYEILGFEKGRAFLQEYAESFYYEAFSHRLDGRGRKVGLFVFENMDVYFRRLDVDQTTRPAMVSCREGKRITLPADGRQKDMAFYELIQDSLGAEIYSTIYLVGNGFSQEWAKKSVALLCKAQRKVYFGNNLYAKGACEAAREKVEDKRLKAYLYIGGDVVRYNVGMEMMINGVPGYYPLIAGGGNWYDSEASCEVLLDEEDSIRLQIGEMYSKERRTIAMKLDGLPDRPPKASRVRIEVSFTSGTAMRVWVTDPGFGDLYPTSGKTWEEVLTEAGGKRV